MKAQKFLWASLNMAGLPKGYMAINAEAGAFAVDAGTVSKTGEVHLGGIGGASFFGSNTSDALDSFVEFSINGDTRLEGLKKEAQALGKQYGDPKSADYIADDRTREETIVNKLGNRVYEIYGAYSNETAENYSAAERESRGVLFDTTVRLADMEKDSLVCRHQAAIMGVLMHEAGVKNHIVASTSGTVIAVRDELAELRFGEEVRGKMYGNPDNEYYIADPKVRAAKIIDMVMFTQGQKIGDESMWKAGIANDTRDMHTRLGEMSPDLARLTAVALKAGGINDPKVDALVKEFPDSPPRFEKDPENKQGGHLYVVTKSGAIVEATSVGPKSDLYKPIVNNVTVENIVYHGQTALVNGSSSYGGHTGRGDRQLANVETGVGYSIERHNDSLVKPPPLKFSLNKPDTSAQLEKEVQLAETKANAMKSAEQDATNEKKSAQLTLAELKADTIKSAENVAANPGDAAGLEKLKTSLATLGDAAAKSSSTKELSEANKILSEVRDKLDDFSLYLQKKGIDAEYGANTTDGPKSTQFTEQAKDYTKAATEMTNGSILLLKTTVEITENQRTAEARQKDPVKGEAQALIAEGQKERAAILKTTVNDAKAPAQKDTEKKSAQSPAEEREEEKRKNQSAQTTTPQAPATEQAKTVEASPQTPATNVPQPAQAPSLDTPSQSNSPADRLKQAGDLLKSYDLNKDGTVTVGEFQQSGGAAKIGNKLDINGDGVTSKNEISAALKNSGLSFDKVSLHDAIKNLGGALAQSGVKIDMHNASMPTNNPNAHLAHNVAKGKGNQI